MALTPTNVLNNSSAPGIAAEIYVPDQLIAGQFQPVTQPVTIASGAGVLTRGTVLGASPPAASTSSRRRPPATAARPWWRCWPTTWTRPRPTPRPAST